MTNESMIIMIKQNIDFPIYFLQILRSLLLLLLVLFYIEFESVSHLVCVCVLDRKTLLITLAQVVPE